MRIAQEPVEIFESVLRSLELRRPKKAERDILDDLRDHYQLPPDPKLWPSALVGAGVTPDDFLKYVLDRLSSFVEMVVDIYEFLHSYASTTGGKTQHFVIESDDLSNPWSFDVSRLPRLIKWIDAWLKTRVEEVTIDWEAVSDLLGVDNGVFYGDVSRVPLVQALVVARHDRSITPRGSTLGDHIYDVLKRAASAWYLAAAHESRLDASESAPTFTVFVPNVAAKYPRHRRLGGGDGRNTFAVDLHRVLLGARGYSADDVFLEPDVASDLSGWMTDARVPYGVSSAVWFCALWGLDEDSFDDAMRLLLWRPREIIGGADLDHAVQSLGDQVAQLLSALIVPTGNVTERQERGKRRLELLLLPYWRDRWYLFEVWTLILVLRLAKGAGAQIALRGVEPAPGDVSGTVWHLPTQKAKTPVAEASNASNLILVWFQRETRRIDDARNMEPDVRITSGEAPFDDVAIVECKDRIKFSGAPSDRVARSYLSGSVADPVWIVNYEDDTEVRCRVSTWNDRWFGIANGFRPRMVPEAFLESVRSVVRDRLHIGAATSAASAGLHFLVIDSSGSMDGKKLPDSEDVKAMLLGENERVLFWNDDVVVAGRQDLDALRAHNARIHGTSAEDGAALAAWVRGLPVGASITVITDADGRGVALARAEKGVMSGAQSFLIDGKPLEFVII